MGSAVLASSLPVPGMSDGEGPKGQGLSQLGGGSGGEGEGRLKAQGRQGAKSHSWGPCQMLDFSCGCPTP